MILTPGAIATYMEARQALSRLVGVRAMNFIDTFERFDENTAGHILTAIDYDDGDPDSFVSSRQFHEFLHASNELNKLKDDNADIIMEHSVNGDDAVPARP